jgi:hypothetical protein
MLDAQCPIRQELGSRLWAVGFRPWALGSKASISDQSQ